MGGKSGAKAANREAQQARADEQARQAARDVMRYFDQAAPQHHLDEERHVFPALLAAGDPALGRTVRQLMEDHGRMEALWAQARELLAALAEDRLSAFEPAHQAALREFASLYDRHIADEEQVAYPAARRSLDEADLAAMAGDMMRRRGVITRRPELSVVFSGLKTPVLSKFSTMGLVMPMLPMHAMRCPRTLKSFWLLHSTWISPSQAPLSAASTPSR